MNHQFWSEILKISKKMPLCNVHNELQKLKIMHRGGKTSHLLWEKTWSTKGGFEVLIDGTNKHPKDGEL